MIAERIAEVCNALAGSVALWSHAAVAVLAILAIGLIAYAVSVYAAGSGE